MDMYCAYHFPIQMIAALLPVGMVIFGVARWTARRSDVRARIAERCARIVESTSN